MRLRVPGARRQRGLAMIAVLTLIALLSAYLIADRMGSTSTELLAEREKLTQKALRDAKAALLGYVAKSAADTDNDLPGQFPCPEDASKIGLSTEGGAQGAIPASCNDNSAIQIGRLPWRTLNLGGIRDGWGEKLWYVLSPGFRTSPINSSTPGQLTLDGKPVVALIISTGPAINSQVRPAPSLPVSAGYFASASVYANYLDGENASSPIDANFTSAGSLGAFNDRVIAITQQEVFDVVEPSVANRIQSGTSDVFQTDLSNYSNVWNAYPFAVPFGDPTTSGYRGVAGTYQGLFPSTSKSSDPTFVAWGPSSISVISGPGSVTSSSCSGSQVLTCTIVYRRSGFFSPNTPNIAIALTANNVGMAFRDKIRDGSGGLTSQITYSYSGGSFNPSSPSDPSAPTQSLTSSGDLTVSWASYRLPRYTGSGTRTFRITIETPDDHAILSNWFFTNQWNRYVYYAVAPDYVPHTQPYVPIPGCGGCVTLSNPSTGTTMTDNKAVVIMFGRALASQSQPSGNVAYYLDGTNATNAQSGTLSFVQNPRGVSLNDVAVKVQ